MSALDRGSYAKRATRAAVPSARPRSINARAPQADPSNNIPLSPESGTPAGIWDGLFRNKLTGNNPLSADARNANVTTPDQTQNDPNDDSVSAQAPPSISTLDQGGPTHIQMWGSQLRSPAATNYSNKGGAFTVPNALTGPMGNATSDAANLSANQAMYTPVDRGGSAGGFWSGRGAAPSETWQAPTRSDAAAIGNKYGSNIAPAITVGSRNPLPAQNFQWGSNNAA